MAVDRHSPEFLFGQIMARLNEGDKVMTGLQGEVAGMRKDMADLPCRVHDEQIKDIEAWQRNRNNKSQKLSESSLTLKHGLIIGLLAAAAAAGFSALFNLL